MKLVFIDFSFCLVQCSPPDLPEKGLLFESPFFSFGETIKFQCSGGYKPTGSLSATCGADGTFGNITIECSKSKSVQMLVES